MDVEPTNTSPPVAPENDELPPDTEPVFLEVGDGEEVVVDDSAPIEDEEEEAVVEDVASMEDNTIEEEEDGEKIVPQVEILCHRGPVYALSLTQKLPNQFIIASGGGDDAAFATTLNLSASPLKPTSQVLGTNSESVANASFSKDRSLLATGDYAGTISLWNCPVPAQPSDPTLPPPPGGEELKLDRTLPPGPTDCEWLVWHPLGNVFAVGSTDGTIWMYLAKTGAVMQVFAGHDGDDGSGGGGVTCGAFSLCGKHLLSGGGDGTFRIWNPKNGTARAVIKTNSPVNTIPQKAEGDIVAVGGANGEINVVHLPTKKIVGAPMEHSSSESEVASVECLKFHGAYLASGAVDGNVKIFEVGVGGSNASGLLRSTAKHLRGGVTCLEWKRGGGLGDRNLFTGCADGMIRMWDARPSEAVVLRCFKGHGDMVLCMDLSDDGRVMVSGSDDHKILVWAL